MTALAAPERCGILEAFCGTRGVGATTRSPCPLMAPAVTVDTDAPVYGHAT
ncbi:MAG: hypothetical protein AB7N91_05560 [Candidatus Tectimicrobiota bacterium]